MNHAALQTAIEHSVARIHALASGRAPKLALVLGSGETIELHHTRSKAKRKVGASVGSDQ